MPHIALDTTPVDTMHRSRGIGRYAQGLIQGFSRLEQDGDIGDITLTLLRQPHEGSLSVDPGALTQHTLGRFFTKEELHALDSEEEAEDSEELLGDVHG